jgi:hypothetical protein
VGTNEWVYAVLPFVTMAVLGAGLYVVFRQRAAARRNGSPGALAEPGLASPPRDRRARPARPWWGSPLLWLGLSLLFLILGWLVRPWLFGGVFIFLPFVWIWRPRTDPRMDPRTNGHTSRDAGSFSGD